MEPGSFDIYIPRLTVHNIDKIEKASILFHVAFFGDTSSVEMAHFKDTH